MTQPAEPMLCGSESFGPVGICSSCGSVINGYLLPKNNEPTKRIEWHETTYWAACSNSQCQNSYGFGYNNLKELDSLPTTL